VVSIVTAWSNNKISAYSPLSVIFPYPLVTIGRQQFFLWIALTGFSKGTTMCVVCNVGNVSLCKRRVIFVFKWFQQIYDTDILVYILINWLNLISKSARTAQKQNMCFLNMCDTYLFFSYKSLAT